MRVRRTNSPQMHLEKLLHEFPWLWAIQPRWTAVLDTIAVTTAAVTLLKKSRRDVGFPDMWVKIRRPRGGTWVLKTNNNSGQRNLAEYALQSARKFDRNDEVEGMALVRTAVVIGTNLSSFLTVYTERRPGDFHRLCLEAIESLPELKTSSSDLHFLMGDDCCPTVL